MNKINVRNKHKNKKIDFGKGFIQYLNLNLVGYEPRLKFCGEIIA